MLFEPVQTKLRVGVEIVLGHKTIDELQGGPDATPSQRPRDDDLVAAIDRTRARPSRELFERQAQSGQKKRSR